VSIKPHRAGLVLAVFLTVVGGKMSAVRAKDETSNNFIADALAYEILEQQQVIIDVQEFVEPRIPEMPDVKTEAEWQQAADQIRSEVLDKVIFRGQAKAWRDAETEVEWLETIEGGPGYQIKKFRYEALPGLWVPALLYEPTNLNGPAPVVLNVNGHDGEGKAAPYKQIRCINQSKRGIIALNVEWLGMGQLRGDEYQHGLINAIDLCGTSGIATHFLAQTRALDLLLDHPNADPTRVGVTGLSGGGWQTIFFSALDPRVTLANPVAGYSSFRTRLEQFSDLGDSEQTPSDLATVADYNHLTALLAPRPSLLTFNMKDNCCFAAPHAIPPLARAATPIFSVFDEEDNLRFHVNLNPGDHNYGQDNRQAFYRLIGDHWFTDDPDFDPAEIAVSDEIKTAEELHVPLPENNRTLHSIAMDLSADLPQVPERPDNLDEQAWQNQRRKELRGLVKPITGKVITEQIRSESHNGISASFHQLRLADAWTVPVVVLEPKDAQNSQGTALLMADSGRADEKTEAVANKLLNDGHRVVAFDPFFFGESVPSERDYLWAS